MPEEDVVFAKEYAEANGLKLIWCLCINANLYIENKVPPVEMLMKHDCPIVLGTDSYSSNWQLSIAKEMQALSVPRLKAVAPMPWHDGAFPMGYDQRSKSIAMG